MNGILPGASGRDKSPVVFTRGDLSLSALLWGQPDLSFDRLMFSFGFTDVSHQQYTRGNKLNLKVSFYFALFPCLLILYHSINLIWYGSTRLLKGTRLK